MNLRLFFIIFLHCFNIVCMKEESSVVRKKNVPSLEEHTVGGLLNIKRSAVEKCRPCDIKIGDRYLLLCNTKIGGVKGSKLNQTLCFRVVEVLEKYISAQSLESMITVTIGKEICKEAKADYLYIHKKML